MRHLRQDTRHTQAMIYPEGCCKLQHTNHSTLTVHFQWWQHSVLTLKACRLECVTKLMLRGLHVFRICAEERCNQGCNQQMTEDGRRVKQHRPEEGTFIKVRKSATHLCISAPGFKLMSVLGAPSSAVRPRPLLFKTLWNQMCSVITG